MGLRALARELLAYLALHPAATGDECVDALLPDADPDAARQQLHTAASNARSVLRSATGARSAGFLLHAAGRYRLDETLVGCDWWALDTACRRAATASDDAACLAALERAEQACAGGPPLTGAAWEWAEPARETMRRRGIDALAHLADLRHRRGDDERALAALDQALTMDRTRRTSTGTRSPCRQTSAPGRCPPHLPAPQGPPRRTRRRPRPDH